MAAITATSLLGNGSRAMAVTTLGASDTVAFSSKALLVLDNVTAGALTPKIDGDGGTTVSVAGIGDVSVASGLTIASIGAGDKAVIPLDSIREYCRGTVTVTGGDGIEASLLTY